MEKFEFKSVEVSDHDAIYEFTSVYGERSCQHSPVSMYSLKEKYDDQVCIKDGFLYTLRNGLCDDTYRVYLAPLGGGDVKKAVMNVISDAHSYGKKVKFYTVTDRYVRYVDEWCPDIFQIEEDRDFAEYIYGAESMGTFAGGKLAKRRAEVHRFRNIYGDRAKISLMTKDDVDEALAFERQWVVDNTETHDEKTLLKEERMIQTQLPLFDELHLCGAVVRIDGVIVGYCYGTMLQKDCFDVIVEKGNRAVPHIYKVIRMESTKLLLGSEGYVNMEEDVGEPGLRKIKSAYKPEYLLRKYIVTEK